MNRSGVSADIIVPETLSISEELIWFYRGLRNSTHCQAVLECLCEITDVSYESVVASDDSNAERMEVSELEESIDLDARSFVSTYYDCVDLKIFGL